VVREAESVELVVVVVSVQLVNGCNPGAPMKKTKHRNRRRLETIDNTNKPATHIRNTF